MTLDHCHLIKCKHETCLNLCLCHCHYYFHFQVIGGEAPIIILFQGDLVWLQRYSPTEVI
jgi:hypothetical protein